MTKLLDSLDVIIFVIVLLVAGYMLGAGAGMGLDEKDAAIEKADSAKIAVESALRNATYKGDEGYKILTRLKELPAEIEEHWSPEVKGRAFTDGVFYHPASIDDVREERDLELRFLAPKNLQASTDIGRVRVFWEVPNENTVTIKEFEVYRGPEDNPTLVAKVGGTESSFVDTDVKAGELYKYRVRALSDDVMLIKSKREMSGFSAPVDVRGARDYSLRIVKYNSTTKTARILVRRYVIDVWHEKEFDVVEGKTIGVLDSGSGINYATPCVAVRFEEGTETVPEVRDEVAFDRTGQVILGENNQPITKNVSYKRIVQVVKVFFRNELGQEESLLLKK
ncbi:MAG: hypothetical protein ACI97A_001275 [Planctomycetota bacterium]|jgi:hypothetical protein